MFAGSEADMMEQLFGDETRPLYGSAVPMRLGRLLDADIAGYVVERFTSTGRDVGDALTPLLSAAHGHPKQAMLLAHRVWEETPAGVTAGIDEWARAHAAALAELDAEFDAQWRRLTVSEQKTLRAVIDGKGSPYRASLLQALSLTKSIVQKALPKLRTHADVEEDERGLRLVDREDVERYRGKRGSSRIEARSSSVRAGASRAGRCSTAYTTSWIARSLFPARASTQPRW